MIKLLDRFRHSIAFRITWVFLALLLASTVGVVLTLRHYVQRDLEELTRSSLIGAMGRLESELFQLRNELSVFAELSAHTAILQGHTLDQGAAAVQVNLVEKSRERGIDVDTFTRNGRNVPQSGILERAFAGISTVDFAMQGDGRVQLVAAAPSGSFGGEGRVTTASFPLGREFLREKKASLGADVMLMAKGDHIASSSTCKECQDCVKKVLLEPQQWSLLESGKSIYFTVDCEPASQAAVAFPIKTFDGKTAAIVITRTRADEERALYHATVGVTGGTVAFSVAMAIAFFLISSRAFRPLSELTRITKGIFDGQYGETVKVEGGGEVADLASAFNMMSVSLQQANSELSEWNRMLESRVEEKSKELEKIHGQMVEVEKLAAMGQLAAGVAHELNNPLSGIMGYSEIALELFKDKPPEAITTQDAEKMLTYFSHIENLSQRCRVIILDMLKFARQHTEEFHDINIVELIRQTLIFLDKVIVRKNVIVIADLPDGLPSVRGNGLQIQQVFTNLILNAIQAMPDGGNLIIKARRDGNALMAEFTDHGVGIFPEHLKRIFEPFFTTKPVGEGTGLGLSVSYGIIKHHGGEITVSSEAGKGSTFTVSLPLQGKA